MLYWVKWRCGHVGFFLAEISIADIKECKILLKDVEREIPQLLRDKKEIKKKGLRNLKDINNTGTSRYKEFKKKKTTRFVKKSSASSQRLHHSGPPPSTQWLTAFIDWRAEKKEVVVKGIHQFIMRHQRDEIWRLTKNSKFLKKAGIRFKKDFSKVDRDA